MHAYPAGGSTADDGAFAAMCEQHRARLVAYCARRLGTRHDAEDAAHEVFLRAHRALARFDDDGNAWPWLRTIATRVCTDMQRRAARVAAAGDVDRPASGDVHEHMAARVRAEIVDDALDRLSPRYRSALVLREYGGWSYDEIAHVQGRSRASVRSLLTRGRRRLGDEIESVARTRGQWPLPGGVPPLQRLREHVRSWREELGRSGQAAVGFVELSTVAGRWFFSANVALSSALGLASLATTTPVSLRQPTLIASPAPSTTSDTQEHGTSIGVTTRAANAEVDVAARTPSPTSLAKIGTTTPGGNASTVTFEGGEKHVWITIDEETPTDIGDFTLLTNIPCTSNPVDGALCAVARTVLPYVPER